MKSFEEIFLQLQTAFATGDKEYCPKCGRPADVVSNPMYHWHCDHCGHEMDYRDMPVRTVKERVREIITDHSGSVE